MPFTTIQVSAAALTIAAESTVILETRMDIRRVLSTSRRGLGDVDFWVLLARHQLVLQGTLQRAVSGFHSMIHLTSS